MHNREALHQKVGKANFDLVYDLEDPREYFNTLRKFDYCIPQHGQRLFSELIEARREASRDGDKAKRFRVVDVCCSYGINGTLLKYETTSKRCTRVTAPESLPASLARSSPRTTPPTTERAVGKQRPRSSAWTWPRTPSLTVCSPVSLTRASPRTWRRTSRPRRSAAP